MGRKFGIVFMGTYFTFTVPCSSDDLLPFSLGTSSPSFVSIGDRLAASNELEGAMQEFNAIKLFSMTNVSSYVKTSLDSA